MTRSAARVRRGAHFRSLHTRVPFGMHAGERGRPSASPIGNIGGTGVLKRTLLAAALIGMVASPTMAEWRLPCILAPGCSVTFVSPDYAARPVEPLNAAAALAAVNAFRSKNGRGSVVLDTRLLKAAAMQSETQAKRS